MDADWHIWLNYKRQNWHGIFSTNTSLSKNLKIIGGDYEAWNRISGSSFTTCSNQLINFCSSGTGHAYWRHYYRNGCRVRRRSVPAPNLAASGITCFSISAPIPSQLVTLLSMDGMDSVIMSSLGLMTPSRQWALPRTRDLQVISLIISFLMRIASLWIWMTVRYRTPAARFWCSMSFRKILLFPSQPYLLCLVSAWPHSPTRGANDCLVCNSLNVHSCLL